MRPLSILKGEYYHIYNRGNRKQPLFHEKIDVQRFLLLIILLQSPLKIENLNRILADSFQGSALSSPFNISQEIIRQRYVELVNFCIMSNHFHLTVKEVMEDGIRRYLHRLQTSYVRYFNIKYRRSGHLFQGKYRAVHITNDEQLVYLSAYIHLNPRDMVRWKNKEDQYPWSSFQDYVQKNRWGRLLSNQIVLEQCKNINYKQFVYQTGAKQILEDQP